MAEHLAATGAPPPAKKARPLSPLAPPPAKKARPLSPTPSQLWGRAVAASGGAVAASGVRSTYVPAGEQPLVTISP